MVNVKRITMGLLTTFFFPTGNLKKEETIPANYFFFKSTVNRFKIWTQIQIIKRIFNRFDNLNNFKVSVNFMQNVVKMHLRQTCKTCMQCQATSVYLLPCSARWSTTNHQEREIVQFRNKLVVYMALFRVARYPHVWIKCDPEPIRKCGLIAYIIMIAAGLCQSTDQWTK